MPDFGIGELIAALTAGGAGLFGGLGGAAAGAEAAALPAEVGAITLPEIAVTAAAPAFGAGDALAGIGLAGGLGAGADALSAGEAAAGTQLADAGGFLNSEGAINALGPIQGINTDASGIPSATPGATTSGSSTSIQPTPVQTQTFSASAPTGGPGPGAAGTGPPSSVNLGDPSTFIGPSSDLAPSGAGIAGTAAPGGVQSLISKLGTNTADALTKPGNLLTAALAAPLLKNLISPPQVPQAPQLNALSQGANQFASQQSAIGTALTQPLLTGQLPPAAQQSIQNAVQDAITSTKAKYANLGLSGSTAEADAISNIQNQQTAIRFQIAEQMAQTGLNATSQAANTFGLQDQIFSQLMNAQVTQDQALQQALARFAAASAGGGTNVNLKLAS
jgi:hypothetical protein